MEDVVGAGEVEAAAARLEGDEEEVDVALGPPVDELAASLRGGLAVEVEVREALAIELAPDQLEEARELAEDQRALPGALQLKEVLEEHVDLR